MTVQSTNNKVFALGDGITREIPYAFRIYRDSDFVVIQTNLLTGVDSAPLILHTDYEVTGAGGYNGGNIVLTNPAPVNTLTTGVRLLSTTQLTDLRNQGGYFAEIHEDVFDRLAMVGQQQQEQIYRSFKLPVSVSNVSAELPRPVPGRTFKWSPDGSELINSDVDPDSLANAAAASAQDAANSAFSANTSLIEVAELASEVEVARFNAETSANAAAASAASIDPANIVHRTGNESIAGTKAFTDSPTVPTPTSSNQAANKSYVDQFIAQLPITGLLFSTPGASNAMKVSAGRAVDSTGSVVMSLASSITKTTAAWAVGNAGGLDTGTIANNTWYHFYEIRRPDTGVVDVTFSLSPTTPNLPANYTQFRHVGFGFINASGQWRRFFHDGDDWTWETPALDVDVVPGTAAAVLRTLAVPSGLSVKAKFNYACYDETNSNIMRPYFSDPRTVDMAPSSTLAPLSSSAAMALTNVAGSNFLEVRTNASAQIRSRLNVGSTAVLKISTLGWSYKRSEV